MICFPVNQQLTGGSVPYTTGTNLERTAQKEDEMNRGQKKLEARKISNELTVKQQSQGYETRATRKVLERTRIAELKAKRSAK